MKQRIFSGNYRRAKGKAFGFITPEKPEADLSRALGDKKDVFVPPKIATTLPGEGCLVRFEWVKTDKGVQATKVMKTGVSNSTAGKDPKQPKGKALSSDSLFQIINCQDGTIEAKNCNDAKLLYQQGKSQGTPYSFESLGLSDVVTGTRIGNRFEQNRNNVKLAELSECIREGIGEKPDIDRNPYNFAECAGDKHWEPESADQAKHHEEHDGRLSGILDVTFKTKTPIFVPQGTIEGKSPEFFTCVEQDDGKEHFAIPGSTVKGVCSSLFEALTNSRAKVTSETLDEVPLYRRRATKLYLVTSAPDLEQRQDGKVVECKFDFLDDKNRIQKVRGRDPGLDQENAVVATERGVVIENWRANTLWVESNNYKHGPKKKIAYRRTGTTLTLTWETIADFESMRGHRHLKDHLGCSRANPPANRYSDRARDYSDWSNEEKARLHRIEVGDILFGIPQGNSLACFGRNVNFLWPAPKSPKQAMGKDGAFAARSEKDAPFSQSDSAELTFGFAADHKKGEEDHHPFRGRVRFTTFWGPEASDTSCQLGEVRLMPLTAPPGTKAKCRPLYLKVKGDFAGDPGTTWTTPGAKLRGRKFYWHQTPPAGQDIANVHLYDKMIQKSGPQVSQGQLDTLAMIKPLQTGVAFKGQVHFTNLTKAELGALLASLDPSLLWQPEGSNAKSHGVKIGKGKPRGLGSVEANIKVRILEGPSDRYGSLTTPSISAKKSDDYVKEYKVWAEGKSPHGLWDDLPFAQDLENLLAIPQEPSLRIYPPRFDMYGWMPEFGKAEGETSNDQVKCQAPMKLARNLRGED